MKKIVLSLTALLLMSSCNIYTKYKPATEVPADLYGSIEARIDSANSIDRMEWRELFTDPQLQQLIEKGLKNNTDLLTAQLRIEESEASLLSARLAFLPSLAFAPQGTISTVDNGRSLTTYQLPINASWEVDIFGRLRNAKEGTHANYLKSKEYAQAVRCRLIASIANTYYTLLMLDQQIEITETTVQNWKEGVEATRSLKNAGMTTEAALGQTEAAYHSIINSVYDLREKINKTENSMALLLAETPTIIPRSSLNRQQLPHSFAVGIPIRLLSNRPDVRTAELTLAAAFYNTNMAHSGFYPTITLSGSAGWTNSAGGAIFNPATFLATSLASLTQPIFNKGTNIARLKIAKAQQEQALLAFKQQLLNAGSEVNNYITQYQTARNKSEQYTAQVTALQKTVNSTELLMQHGTTNYLEVLTARRSLLMAQLSQVANQFTEMQGIVNLYQSLGGGRETLQ